jgi:hypothetical protein
MAKKQKKFNPGMVVHACNFRLRQEEHEFQVSLGLCSKTLSPNKKSLLSP